MKNMEKTQKNQITQKKHGFYCVKKHGLNKPFGLNHLV